MTIFKAMLDANADCITCPNGKTYELVDLMSSEDVLLDLECTSDGETVLVNSIAYAIS